MKSIILAFLTIIHFTTSGIACTTFSHDRLLGKSYDWGQKEAAIILNKKNVAKSSLVLHPSDVAHRWTSNYASLTFNQYGQEFPNGGINEKGLAVEIMVLDDTKFPNADSRGSLNELQWIQYQLDEFDSVKDVVEALNHIRISKVYADVHYTVCDAGGSCATIEFLDGAPIIHRDDTLPYAALTNSTYESSLAELKRYQGFGGALALPLSATGSLGRFVVAASRSVLGKEKGIDYAFETLTKVKVEGHSKWNIVYDLRSLVVHFRTSDKKEIKKIALGAQPYSCKEPNLFVDIQTDKKGDLSNELKPFSVKDNEALVSNTFAGIGLSQALVKKAASYPLTTRCED